jgi:hypothetical protein
MRRNFFCKKFKKSVHSSFTGLFFKVLEGKRISKYLDINNRTYKKILFICSIIYVQVLIMAQFIEYVSLQDFFPTKF